MRLGGGTTLRLGTDGADDGVFGRDGGGNKLFGPPSSCD